MELESHKSSIATHTNFGNPAKNSVVACTLVMADTQLG